MLVTSCQVTPQRAVQPCLQEVFPLQSKREVTNLMGVLSVIGLICISSITDENEHPSIFVNEQYFYFCELSVDYFFL